MEAIVLAAGSGARIQSKTPLVLHKVAEQPLIFYAIHALLHSGAFKRLTIVVNPSGADQVRKTITEAHPDANIHFVQYQPAADATAVSSLSVGLTSLAAKPDSLVAVIPANLPLLQPVVDNLLHCCPAQQAAEASEPLSEPHSEYSSRFASHFQLAWQPNQAEASCEADGPILIARLQFLAHQLQDALAKKLSLDIALQQHCTDSPDSCLRLASPPHLLAPVNTRRGLMVAEQHLKSQLITALGDAGVTFRDPTGTFLGPQVQIGRDSVIGVGVQLYGKTKIGSDVRIEGPSILTNATVGDGCHIRAFTCIEDAVLEAEANAGPYARIRIGSRLECQSYVGNFVEVKNAHLSRNSLACHLAYLGDTHVGPRTNIGAGTITCNYDGVAKNATTIGAGAFVGSNSTLVAPVTVGDGALVAAGSVVTQDVAPGAAAFARARQNSRDGFAEILRSRSHLRHNSMGGISRSSSAVSAT